MDDARFWTILQEARPPGQAPQLDCFDALKACLRELPPEEILWFRQRFDEVVAAAYRVDLWGAAYLINGGCSDDGFHHFRCWLAGMGRKVYENALASPDSLADVLTG